MTLINETLKEFTTNLSSSAPAPGGGSASAYTGALGASLYMMVLAVAQEKAEDHAPFEKLINRIRPYRDRLLELVDLDTQAFNAVMAAFKMPKATEEEKALRREAVQKAMIIAAEVPLETMSVCHATLEFGTQAVEWGAKAAASDVGVGTLLLMAGLSGAMLNVEINLPSIKDEGKTKELGEAKEQIHSKAMFIEKCIREKLAGLGL